MNARSWIRGHDASAPVNDDHASTDHERQLALLGRVGLTTILVGIVLALILDAAQIGSPVIGVVVAVLGAAAWAAAFVARSRDRH